MKLNSITFRGIPDNYGVVDNVLSRSAQPMAEDFPTLKEQGVTDIIDFRTHFVESKDVNFNEAEVVKKLGMKYHPIPSYTRYPSEKNIHQFLNIVDNIAQNGGKAHVHCKAGADRTGMYVFIYKHVKGMGNFSDNLQEWLMFGHHRQLFPNLIGKTIKLIEKMKL